MGLFYRSFYQIQNSHKKAFEIYTEIAKHNCIELTVSDKKVGFDIKNHEQLSPIAKSLLRDLVLRNNQADYVEGYIYTRIINEGPKVFKPTALQLTMLEQMTLNITVEDYAQPFSTVIIDLPKEYIQYRSATLPQGGAFHVDRIMPDSHRPTCAVLYFSAECKSLMFVLFFDTGYAIKTTIHLKANELMESKINIEGNMFDSSLDVSEDEMRINNQLLRATINYCLLLDEVGVKKVGPENENYYERLIKYRDKAAKRKDLDQTKRNANEIKNHPIIYTILNQNVKLYQTTNSHKELINSEHNMIMPPHHRRGHYRMQRHGPGNTLTKRIRIPPVFVNAHLFVGDMTDARATYQS